MAPGSVVGQAAPQHAILTQPGQVRQCLAQSEDLIAVSAQPREECAHRLECSALALLGDEAVQHIELVPVMFAQFLHPRVQASDDTLVRGQHQRCGRTQVKPVERSQTQPQRIGL